MTTTESSPKRLGDLQATIVFSRWDMAAAGFILAVMGGGGVLLVVASLRGAYLAGWAPGSWIGVAICTLVGVSSILGGCRLSEVMRGQWTHRFDFCLNGFRYYHRGSLDRVLWSQISCIREIPSSLPKHAASGYKIVTVSGKEFDFKGKSRAVRELGALLRARADEYSLPWETVEA